jgi:hypothetical protein
MMGRLHLRLPALGTRAVQPIVGTHRDAPLQQRTSPRRGRGSASRYIPFRLIGRDGVKRPNLHLQHVMVEKQQGGEGLVLGEGSAASPLYARSGRRLFSFDKRGFRVHNNPPSDLHRDQGAH